MRAVRDRAALVLCLVAACALVAGCARGADPDAHGGRSPAAASSSETSGAPASASAATVPADVVMKAPGALTASLLSPDILVFSRDTLSTEVLARLSAVHGVVAANRFSLAQFFHEDRSVTYAAVDPATFRRFAPAATAAATQVWDRVADGEMALSRPLATAIASPGDTVRMGNASTSPAVRIGAYADLTPTLAARTFVDAVVNEKWAARLHMVPDNAIVLSTGATAPDGVARAVQKIVGKDVTVSILAHTYDLKAVQTAVVTGTSVAQAIGHYTYTANANGTINPDPAWVHEYIRTEQVPILGTVTCNKIMLPELRAALTEVQQDGLASKVYHYDGCFVPRFINHDPADGISNHSFGTAIDINAAQNQRGTSGQMDRRVVAIFEKWGFTWGGTWHYTDPMHFELNRIVEVG